MSDERSTGSGNLAVLFAVLTLGAICVNARVGWHATTLQEVGAAFATTGAPLLAVGALLTGLPAMRAHRYGGREARLAVLAGGFMAVAIVVHASLAVAGLTVGEPYDPDKPVEVRVIK